MQYLLAIFFPFVCLLVEKILPYPYLIEEISKYFIVKKTDSTKEVLLYGLLFSLSESIFYVMNPTYIQNPILFINRVILVTPMHMATITITWYFKRKNIAPIGLIASVFVHFVFNSLSMI